MITETTAKLTYTIHTATLYDMGYSEADVERFAALLLPALESAAADRWPELEVEIEVVHKTTGYGAGPRVNDWGENEGRPDSYTIESEAREISNAVLEGVV